MQLQKHWVNQTLGAQVLTTNQNGRILLIRFSVCFRQITGRKKPVVKGSANPALVHSLG